MTLFIALSVVMLLAALGWVLPSLWRRGAAPTAVDQAHENLAILKDQLADLDADERAGVLPAQQVSQRRAEIERRALAETGSAGPAPAKAKPATNRMRASAACVAIAVPLLAGAMYVRLGDPYAAELAQLQRLHAAQQAGEPELDRFTALLTRRLADEPDSVGVRVMLARVLASRGRWSEALAAYQRSAELLPADADLKVEYARALVMGRGGASLAEASALLQRALELDARHPEALAMSGAQAFERKDYPAAIGFWERLRAELPADAPIANQVATAIGEARQRAGNPASAAAPAAATGARSVSGTVALDGKLGAAVKPDDVVFVFARAAQGPRMPLAVARLRVRDLPAPFVLDDSMAMSGAAKLSDFAQVVVGARISKGGAAIAQPGDIEGASGPLALGSRDVRITLDRVVP